MRLVPTRLFNGRLIVEPLKKKEETINGVIVAESVNAELSEGVVVAVADNIKDVLSVGENVLYPTASGSGQWFNNKACIWLTIADVWGVVIPDEK